MAGRRPAARRPAPTRRGGWRRGGGVVADLVRLGVMLTLVAGAAIVLCRVLSFEPGPMAVGVALTPYLIPLGLLAALAGWPAGRPVLSAWALALVVFVAATVVPMFAKDGGSEQTPLLSVATLNLRLGGADTDAVVRMARESSLEVLVLTELTGEAEGRLRAAGLETLLPAHFVSTAPGYPGTGIWSKYAIRDPRRLEGYRSPHLVGVLDTARAGTVTLAAVHPAQPRFWSHADWAAEHAKLRSDLGALAGEVVLVVGDFNATPDQAPMRRLAKDGFVDASGHAGAGLNLTWPRGRVIPGPLFAVDHVLTKGTAAGLTVTTREIPGTDHKALVAQLGRSAWLSAPAPTSR